MKRVVSVSLGSASRDHQARAEFLGVPFEIRRIGVDGDFRKAQALLRELDGQVDAIGLGGVDVYLRAGEQRFAMRDGLRLKNTVTRTPVVDGSGLKDSLEREAVAYLARSGPFAVRGQETLMVCAMDRFGMAEALVEAGARVTFGDQIFALGVDEPITDLETLKSKASKLLPEICKLPISFVYPTGPRQASLEPTPMTDAYFARASLIAGDFHFIRRRLPARLPDRIVLTNTVTAADLELLRERGVEWLVTTTPELEGRSFGTNVLEAIMVCLLERDPEQLSAEDYLNLIQKIAMRPRIVQLQPALDRKQP